MFIWLIVGYVVHHTFYTKTDSFSFYIIFFYSTVIAIPVLSVIYGLISNLTKPKVKCYHGIVDGETKDKCHICVQEKREYEILLQQEAKILANSREKYLQIRSIEEKRVSEFNLKQSSYLREGVTPQKFEDIVAELYRKLGYTVEQTSYTNDGGKDAILHKNGNTYLLECKRYSETNSIGRPDMQKFESAMRDFNAKKGFFVNTGKFSKEALIFASTHNIEPINCEELIAMFNNAYPENNVINDIKVVCLQCGEILKFPPNNSITSKKCTKNHTVLNYYNELLNATTVNKKSCPLCNNKLRIVKGIRGKFWGCSNYPNCRFTKEYNSA